ncbi:MAG: thioredoxin domain-containing protein [bacterium]
MKSCFAVYKSLFLFLILLAASAVHSAPPENALLNHPAPYLSLHGNDPVAWQSYHKEAVERARREGKLLFVSSGYFACHWCHVMQQESYQDAEIADMLNKNFVSIKVDRELEPGLDSRLMDFAQATLGRGGWPLNVFLTPEGYPVYAMLYAPKGQFLEVLVRLQLVWQTDPDKVRTLVRIETESGFPPVDAKIDRVAMQRIIDSAPQKMLKLADEFQGGFGSQSKFPSLAQLQFLLDQYERTGNEELKDFLVQTFDAMATKGMNDHLSGGFFRYTVDPGWEIPHFEKMLYDNAGIAAIYIRAANVLDQQGYHQVARTTLEFMQKYMWREQAFVASFSAVDDRSVEGGHYLWKREQLREVLDQDEYLLLADLWGLDRPDELEAGNQPRWHISVDEYAEKSGRPKAQILDLLDAAKIKMLAVRSERILPVDDKLVAGWNGLALTAFSLAANEYKDESYLETARSLEAFLITKMWDGEQMFRALAGGAPHGTASLQDFAYVARGLWDSAQLSQDEEIQQIAARIARQGWAVFYRNNAWYLEHSSLLAPPSGSELIEDGSSASPAGVLIGVSIDIAVQTGDEQWLTMIYAALNRGQQLLIASPYWYVSQMRAVQLALEVQSDINSLN